MNEGNVQATLGMAGVGTHKRISDTDWYDENAVLHSARRSALLGNPGLCGSLRLVAL
jgi:hypothetical protein